MSEKPGHNILVSHILLYIVVPAEGGDHNGRFSGSLGGHNIPAAIYRLPGRSALFG